MLKRAPTGSEPLFEARGISKSFGATRALDAVDLRVAPGEIMGLIGENGSGKSTMSSIAAGMQPPDAGEMLLHGQPYQPSTMIEGARAGVGMVVQEMGTVPGITVAENIFIGEESQFARFGLISKRRMNRAARVALDAIGARIAPDVLIDTLNMQDRKLVEIAKTMNEHPRLLIIDETSTALSHEGREILYAQMQKMKADGGAVLFISHDLPEMMRFCDRLTVLRDGKLVSTIDKAEMSEQAIKRQMVGRQLSDHYYRSDFDGSYDPSVVIAAHRITTATGLLMNFTMELHKGEILGIGGLSHCGMHELGRAIFGEEPLLTGSVTHVPSGQRITSPVVAMRHRIGYVSKNRDQEALVLAASIRDNIVAAGFDRVATAGLLILPPSERRYVGAQVDSLGIKCASIDQNVQYLSGGNKQKVVFGKWIGRDCDVLILDCPTRGVDIGVRAAMYELIEEMKREGKAILLISEELTELIGMSDRLVILKDGAWSGEYLRTPDLTEATVIEAMI